jgi:hypothetical protein
MTPAIGVTERERQDRHFDVRFLAVANQQCFARQKHAPTERCCDPSGIEKNSACGTPGVSSA